MPPAELIATPADRACRPELVVDPAIVGAYLEDASSVPAGRAAGLVRPRSTEEAAAFLAATRGPVLPQAARSSLTGGAVPAGETILSVERLGNLSAPTPHPGGARVRVGAGVRLCDLQREVAARGYYYPPVPTYAEAMVGGVVATNAGGAATFKYGTTREWVRGLRVLLSNGDTLEIERGQAVARSGEHFAVRLGDGRRLQVPRPVHRLPPLKKISAGYHSAASLDLVDLFIGSEGTLGVVTEAELELVPLPASVAVGLAFVAPPDAALELAASLRELGSDGLRSIEVIDDRGLALLRADGLDRQLRVVVPAASAALLFEMELDSEDAWDGLDTGAGPLGRLLDRLQGVVDLDRLELVPAGDRSRVAALQELREAVPRTVNERLAAARRHDPGVHKVGGDLILPVDELPGAMEAWRTGFESAGLDYAIWGHLSDGNLHPNAVPRTAAEVRAAEELLSRFAADAVRRGGAPLSEHGVGRSPLKQRILASWLGEEAIVGMRRVKAALDPSRRFAPGVLFPPD